MKSKSFSSLLAMIAAVPVLGLGLMAKEGPALKKPTLLYDPSPVSEGKSPVVASYADVVEPVQKAVV